MKKISIGTAVALAAMTAAVTVSLTYLYAMDRFNSKVADVNERQSMYAKLNEIDQKVRRDAVGELDETALKDAICAGYVAGLGDANAKYLSAEKYRIYLQGDVEKSTGVGLRTVQDEDGNMEVIEVLPNSSAEEAGMKQGDVIVAIDGKEVVRLTYGEAVSYLDGAAGTSVTFRVLRASDKEDGQLEQLDFTMERREYTSTSVHYKVVNGNVGYIAVNSFSSNTEEEMQQAVEALQKEKVCGIVLDLRNNAGGSMDSMIQASKWFLPAGSAARYVNSSGETVEEYTAGSDQLGLPLSVLVDDTTHGPAEVLAADIRDGKAGTLVGTTTAGNGSRQETIQLSDGSALILTVGYYIDAQGNSLYGKGVQPDREVTLSVLDKKVLLHGMLEPYDDAQLQTAVTALIESGAAVQEVPGQEFKQTPEESPAPENSGVETDSADESGTGE